jgi:hypothetical protein
MNTLTFQPASFFNEPIPFFDNTRSHQNKEFISCSNFSRMNDGKPPAADEFGIGGGAKSNMVPLALDFVPGTFDVLCGRGKKNYNSTGTQYWI